MAPGCDVVYDVIDCQPKLLKYNEVVMASRGASEKHHMVLNNLHNPYPLGKSVVKPVGHPFDCPYVGYECSVTGNIPELVTHLKDDHVVDMHDGCKFNNLYAGTDTLEMGNASWMLSVFNCYGQQFCLHFEAFLLGMAPCYIAFLRFMGEETDAKMFNYSLEVAVDDTNLAWQGVPRSTRDSHVKVREDLDGLVIPHNLALSFSEGNKQELKLRVQGHIWIEQRDCTLQCGDEEASIVRASHGFVQNRFSMLCLKDTTLWLDHRYDCPFSKCSVSGIIPKLVEHLIDDHNVIMHDGPTFNHQYNIPNSLEMKNRTLMITVIYCYERHFCLQVEGFHLGEAPFYMLFVRFMGDDTEAKQFKYCFRVSGAGRELTWDGVPRSIGEGRKKAIDDLNGLVIPSKLALFISSGNEQELRLRVRGRIWKEKL